MSPTVLRIGDLDLHLFPPRDPAAGTGPLIVLCHGFGAPGTDLISLAPEMRALNPQLEQATFAFPHAPIDLSYLGLFGGRAWFPIDLEAMSSGRVQERMAKMAQGEPDGMGAARRKLLRTIEGLQTMGPRTFGWHETVIGGFSQGAMMALDLALQNEEAPGAVLAWSPTLVHASRWRTRAALRSSMPVFISHGRQDPILPFDATVNLSGLLIEAGMQVDFHAFDGPHTIDRQALSQAAHLVSKTYGL